MNEFAKDALQGNYDFNIKSLVERASAASKKNMSVLLSCLALCFVIMMAYAIGFLHFANIQTPEQLQEASPESIYLAQIILICITAPIFVALTMIGVKTERKEQVKANILVQYFSSLLLLGVATLLVSFLTQLGLAILWVPGLYVMVTTSFTQTLIVDKGLSPISALILSVRVSNRYLMKLVVLYLIFFALFFCVVLTFGFALIWVGPFYFNIKGILYNDLFPDKKTDDVITGEESYFDA